MAARLPPIVSKSNVVGSPSGVRESGISKKITETLPRSRPKIRPAFKPVNPQDPKAILDPSTIIAIVGGHYIITGDVLGDVLLNQPLFVNAPASDREEVEKAMVAHLQGHLNAAIELKLLYVDFMRQPRAAEMFVKIESVLSAKFDEQVLDSYVKILAADTIESREALKLDPPIRRIADMMIRENLTTIGEVDVALARYGTSLAKERKRYAERYAAISVMQKLNTTASKKETTRDQLFEYYESHLVDFVRPARCRWCASRRGSAACRSRA